MRVPDLLHCPPARELQNATRTFIALSKASPLPRWIVWTVLAALSCLLPAIVNLSTSSVPFRLLYALLVPAAYVLLARFCARLPALEGFLCPDAEGGKRPVRFNFRFALAVFAVHLAIVPLFGFVLNFDQAGQWKQAITGQYDDWHPVLHTYMFHLVSRICEDPRAVWFVQIVLLALLCGWADATLRKTALRTGAVRALTGLIAFSPVTLYAFKSIGKDVAFALAVLGLFLALINIGISRGAWLRPWRNKVLFALTVLGATFFRHNGVFLTAPLAVLFPALIGRRNWRPALTGLLLALAACFGYFGLRAHLISSGRIRNHGSQKYVEAIGVPLAMIGDAFVAEPCELSKESIAFCSRLAPLETWRSYYRGFGNDIKSRLDFDYLVREVPPSEFARSVLRIAEEDPARTTAALVRVTGIGWNPFREPVPGKLTDQIDGRHSSDLLALNNLLVHPPLGWVLATPGFAFCSLLIVALLQFLRQGFACLVPAVPLMAYLIGTSLLMFDSGAGDFRFFWAVEMTYPLALAWCFIPVRRETAATTGE